MNDNPYQSPEATSKSPQWSAAIVRRRIFQFLGVVFALALLVALLLPAQRTAREPARRAQCVNNLKQIALGLLNYQSTFGEFPPAYTADDEGNRLHSWRTMILPYIEQVGLHKRVDFGRPWNDPANKAALDTVVPVYVCPSFAGPANHTTYFAVIVPGSCIQPTEGRKLSDITDPHDSTIMVIEVDTEHSVPWMSPTDADLDLILGLAKSESLAHSGRYSAATVNGRVFSVETSVDANKLRAMISIAGGDDETLIED